MNQIKSDFENNFFNYLINRILYLKTLKIQTVITLTKQIMTQYFHVNEINTFLDDLTRHENLSLFCI